MRDRNLRHAECQHKIAAAEKPSPPVIDVEPTPPPPPATPAPPQHPSQPTVKHARLPDGSEFHMRYNAAKVQWDGFLAVPTADGMKAFTGSASSVLSLPRILDGIYRSWLRGRHWASADATQSQIAAAGLDAALGK